MGKLSVMISSSLLVAFTLIPSSAQLMERPPFSYRKGNWTYTAPIPNVTHFGQYLYTSPMGKTCTQNLTIVLRPLLCQTGYVSADYIASKRCNPDAWEMQADMIDALNSQVNVLNETCLQLSGYDYSFNVSAPEPYGGETRALQEMLTSGPRKHGIVGFLARDMYASTANSFGLPYIEAGMSAFIQDDFSATSSTQTMYRIRSDASWLFPGVLKALLPNTFAVMYEENSAAAMAKSFEESAKAFNRTIALSSIVAIKPISRTSSQQNKFLQDLIKQQLRYVLIMSTDQLLPAQFACEVYQAKLLDYVQLVYFGNANDMYSGWPRTTCCTSPSCVLSPDLVKLTENGGFVGLAPGYILETHEDLRINLISGDPGRTQPGSVDQWGRPWSAPEMTSNRSTCFDNSEAVNASLALRAALYRNGSGTLTCYDVMPLGQSVLFGFIHDVARFCPASACRYNPMGAACLISQCCEGSNCTTYDKLPVLATSFDVRCEGKSCRELAYAFSGMAYAAKSYAFTFGGLCQPPCVRNPLLYVYHLGISHPMGDAVWALAQAYICIEQRYGSQGLARLSQYTYRDIWVAAKLQECLENYVEFQGATGKINFKYRHSPTPGYMQVSAQQPRFFGSISFIGSMGPDDAVITHRTFFRKNFGICNVSSSWVPPARICPPDTSVEFVLSDEVNLVSGTSRRLSSSEITASTVARAALPLGSPASCPPGQYPLPFNQSTDPLRRDALECFPCAPGTQKIRVGADLCAPCGGGFFASAGQVACSTCPPNTYSNGITSQLLDYGQTQEFGPANCSNCSDGHYSKTASSKCIACDPGNFRNSTMDSCSMCAEGRYQPYEGSSECFSCQNVLVGSQSARGSKNASECVCGPGSFMASSSCVACLEGLTCPGGTGLPLQTSGYFVQVVDSQQPIFSIYRCRNALQCITGAAGSCASGRTGLACSRCMDLYKEDRSGTCKQCSSFDQAPFLFLIFGVLLVGALFIVIWKVDLTKQRMAYLTLLMTGGQLVTALQSLTAIRQLHIDWQEPVSSFMKGLSFLSLDFKFVNFTCVLGRDSILSNFILKLVTYPFFLIALALGFWIAKLSRRPISVDVMFNLNGTVVTILFITISLALLSPLQCITNPNGTSSMADDPGIVCWGSGDHTVLAVLAILGVLAYPVAIMSWCLWVTITYPSRLASSPGLALNVRYNFLFGRFRTECYYFGVWLLVRNLIIALIPVIFANVAEIQILAMGVIFQVGLAFQTAVWPWRTNSSNFSDMGISMSLVLILLSAAPLLNQYNSAILANVIFAILLILFIGGLMIMLNAIHSRFRPPVFFGIFLCHHKAGAGVLCRFIKMIAGRYTSAALFLDSDELESLDLIFDTVKFATKALVAVLSPELLHRMWCAGEMVSAHRNNIPIVPLICDGFEVPDEAHIDAIPSLWTNDQINTLMSFGITTDMIKEAYHHILSLESMTMPRFGSFADQEGVISKVISRCKLSSFLLSAPASSEKSKPTVLITGGVSDMESLSCLFVMQCLVQKTTQQGALVVRTADEALGELDSALYLLVLFSKGLLVDPTFAEILLVVGLGAADDVEIVTVITDTGFQFPDAVFYSNLEEFGLRSPGLGAESGPALVKAFRSLCNVLALPLSPMGSQGLLEKQVSEICRRFRKLANLDSAMVSVNSKQSHRSKAESFVEELRLQKQNGTRVVGSDTVEVRV